MTFTDLARKGSLCQTVRPANPFLRKSRSWVPDVRAPALPVLKPLVAPRLSAEFLWRQPDIPLQTKKRRKAPVLRRDVAHVLAKTHPSMEGFDLSMRGTPRFVYQLYCKPQV